MGSAVAPGHRRDPSRAIGFWGPTRVLGSLADFLPRCSSTNVSLGLVSLWAQHHGGFSSSAVVWSCHFLFGGFLMIIFANLFGFFFFLNKGILV